MCARDDKHVDQKVKAVHVEMDLDLKSRNEKFFDKNCLERLSMFSEIETR